MIGTPASRGLKSTTFNHFRCTPLRRVKPSPACRVDWGLEFHKIRTSKTLSEVAKMIGAGCMIYFVYTQFFKVEDGFRADAPSHIEKTIEGAKGCVAAGNFVDAVNRYEMAAGQLKNKRMDYSHTAFHVHSALFSLYEELGERVGSNRSLNKALEINGRLLAKMRGKARGGEVLQNGHPASSNAMILRIERAVLLDYAAQRDKDAGRTKDAEKFYRQAITLLTNKEKGVDDINPPKLSDDAKILWVNSLCGVLNNMGVLLSEEGQLEEAVTYLNASAHLAARRELEGAVTEDAMNHTMALRDEALQKIALRNAVDAIEEEETEAVVAALHVDDEISEDEKKNKHSI